MFHLNQKNLNERKHVAVYLEANYSKKLGLPGYSSHQYSLTLKTELNELAQVQAESARLHNLLQSCVDREIQTTGFLPSNNASGNGQNAPACQVTGNGNGNGNGNGKSAEAWACSEKQKALILKIVEENDLDKNQVEILAQDRFGKSVRALNKLEASGLIDELRSQSGGKNAATRRGRSEGRTNPGHPR
jgi:hypothetical protein